MSFIRKHAAILVGLVSPFIRIRKKTVLFSSFGGQYNDNPKYVSIKLHDQYPDYKILWVISNKAKEMPPDYVTVIEYGSIEYFKALYYSQCIIDNHAGLRSQKYERKKWFMMPLYSFLSRKLKHQLCISTWHGTPIKRIAMDEPGAREKYTFKSSSEYMLSGCSYTEKILFESLDKKLRMLNIGTPRNDIFFKNADVEVLKKKLGLPVDKKIILFGPTFRDDVEKSGKIQIETLDIRRLLNILSSKFGGNWCFVFRLHNLVQKAIDTERLRRIHGEVCFIDGNQCDDMAEYLACSDILLNDYSSSMFDYALSKKPCFIYAPDYDSYSTNERGLYFDMMDLPFPFSITQEELLSNIQSFDYEAYSENVDIMLNKLGNYEEGTASEKVVELLKRFVEK